MNQQLALPQPTISDVQLMTVPDILHIVDIPKAITLYRQASKEMPTTAHAFASEYPPIGSWMLDPIEGCFSVLIALIPQQVTLNEQDRRSARQSGEQRVVEGFMRQVGLDPTCHIPPIRISRRPNATIRVQGEARSFAIAVVAQDFRMRWIPAWYSMTESDSRPTWQVYLLSLKYQAEFRRLGSWDRVYDTYGNDGMARVRGRIIEGWPAAETQTLQLPDPVTLAQ